MSNDEIIKKSFCVLPWIHTFVNNSGRYHVCCTGEFSNNEILDEAGNYLNVRQQLPVEAIVNSEHMKKIRKEMLSGIFPESCYVCKKAEDFGAFSRRMVENNAYQYLIDSLIENTDEDGSIEVKIKYADYRTGNTCNLKCRMCDLLASSKWENDFIDTVTGIVSIPHWDAIISDYKTLSLNDQDFVFKDLQNKEKHIERIHFGGGEPLISKSMLDILEYCIQNGTASHICLSYNTNLTLLPKKILECWSYFKEVKIMASIDGVGIVNDYIRSPSVWADIDQNLKFLDKNHEKYNIKEVLISTTVQVNNILHLHKLYEYLATFDFIVKLPNLVLLEHPFYLDISMLPKDLKKNAIRLLNFILMSYIPKEESQSSLASGLIKCITAMKVPVPDHTLNKLQSSFREFTKRYDQKQGLDAFKVNPELYFLFDENDAK